MTMQPQPIATTVRRTLTATPLARAHERLVDARPGRQPRPIPWTKWNRTQYPEPALALALRAQLALAEGEYGAVVASPSWPRRWR
jgi:hypothetical protein